MRVAQVVGKMMGGGVEQVVMNYYRHIDRARFQFDFLVDSDSPLVPREEIGALGGRVFDIPPYQRQLAYQRELCRLFRREGWPIVHSHINSLSVFPLRAARRAGVPVRIAHSHSTSGRGEPLRNAAKALLRTQANRYPTQRLACSRYAGEWLFGRGSSFEVLPNAIELGQYSFDAAARAKLRAELGAGGSTLVVGNVGRFMAQKNHAFLLEMFRGLLASRPDSLLILTGEGELESEVRRNSVEMGLAERVHFLGRRDDVAALYSAFDAFCLPSLYEGLPLVAIEAQRSGLPCLLSDTITREADVTGSVSFLPLSDTSAWVAGLSRLSSSAPSDRRAVSDARLLAYDIEGAARVLEGIYASALCPQTRGEVSA